MKILLADDHPLVRVAFREVVAQLARDVEILECGDWTEALRLPAANVDLDLALVDLRMPGAEAFDALARLCSQHPTLPVVVISASLERVDMNRALRAGAMGFIPKTETPGVILGALRLVLAGGVYVPPALVEGVEVDHGAAAAEELTERQRQVLSLVARGQSNKEIAVVLGLSEATVKVHVTAIFRALHVTNRTQAAMAAERLGLD